MCSAEERYNNKSLEFVFAYLFSIHTHTHRLGVVYVKIFKVAYDFENNNSSNIAASSLSLRVFYLWLHLFEERADLMGLT